MTQRTFPPLPSALAAAALTLLTGCAMAPTTVTKNSAGSPAQPHKTAGLVRGGQQPISGATIQLWAVANTFKGASQALLTPALSTDAGGNFDITGRYQCPANAQVYITSAGGDSGSGDNANIVLAAALGPCSTLPLVQNITIDEVTTVAAAYALAPFAADSIDVGADPAQAVGLIHAMSSASLLADYTRGTAPGPYASSSAVVSVAAVNTVANIIAACVNSAAVSASCSTLLSSTSAADTFAASMAMAQSPGANVSTLYGLITPQSPFAPALGTAPGDFTLGVKITAASMTAPYGIALDGSGNAWVTSSSGNAVTKISPTGGALSGISGYTAGGLLAAQGVAIDNAGNAWIASTGGNAVIEFSPSGVVLSGAGGFTPASLDTPFDLSLDKQGDVFVANFHGNSVTELTSNGAEAATSLSPVNALLSGPTSVAIDSSGNVWVTSSGNGTVLAFAAANGMLDAQSGLTDGWIQGTGQVVVDGSGSAWVASPGPSAVSVFTPSFAAASNSPITSAGLTTPSGLALDGSGNMWVTNRQATGSLTELEAGSGAPAKLALGVLSAPVGVAVDGSGNVWTANSGDDSVTMFIGLATPTVTPIVANLP